MNPYKWCRYCDKIKSECKCARPSIVLCENDHLEAVKQARADALRWVLEQMTDSAPNAVCSGDAGFDMQCGGIIAERARLRALIEKEIEK